MTVQISDLSVQNSPAVSQEMKVNKTRSPALQSFNTKLQRRIPHFGLLKRMRKDPLRFFTEISRDGEDVIPLKMGFDTIYLINHPDHLKRIFTENRDNYVRSKYYRELSPILGDGLFTLEGKAWRKQRKTSQPSVSGPNLVQMVEHMVAATAELVSRLEQYQVCNTPFDITEEAFHLKLDIVMRALFSTQLDAADFEIVLNSLTIILREVEKRVWEIFPIPTWVTTKRNRDVQVATRAMDKIIYGIIDKRLSQRASEGDLLDMIMTAEQVSGWNEDSIRSIRDQMVSIVLAGHETGANALSWLCYELSKNPLLARKIRDEANCVFGTQRPDYKSFQQLEFTHRVFKEILRLYPPLWTVSREALEDDKLGSHLLPKGAVVMLCPYIIHRHPDFWKNPEGFDPDRFTPQEENARLQFSYFPFGGGPHICLGNRFASIEGVLTLALLCQRFDFELCTAQKIEPVPMTTLRPSNRIFMKVAKAEGLTLQAAA